MNQQKIYVYFVVEDSGLTMFIRANNSNHALTLYAEAMRIEVVEITDDGVLLYITEDADIEIVSYQLDSIING